jgi:hypothetical protein
MTTADLVNLVVSRLDSIESHQTAFRKEVRQDVEEIKQLARITNGRVTALERQEIDEKARLSERQKIDQENAEGREKRVAPVRQVMISVAAGVTVAVTVGALSHFGLV